MSIPTIFLLSFIGFALSSIDGISETYYELNNILEPQGRQLPYPKVQNTDSCKQNSECHEIDSICDRFFQKQEYPMNSSYQGSFCVDKPRFEDHVELVTNSSGTGIRRCANDRFCGKDEMCLTANSVRPSDGFCVRLNVCSRSKPASLINGHHSCDETKCQKYNDLVPGQVWKCVNHTVSDAFRFLFFTNRAEESSREISACCLESAGGTCRFGSVTSPPKQCVRNADCFSSPHEPAEWCDGVTRFCCSDASNDTSIQCPDGTMYPFVEQKCDNHNENLPMSGNCSVPNVNATCLHGHCCPLVYKRDNQFAYYLTTYQTNIPCDPKQPLRRFFWAFCDPLIRRVIVLHSNLHTEMQKTKQGKCRNNLECAQNATSVCVWDISSEQSDDKDLGTCMTNPLAQLSAPDISTAYSLFIFSVISTIVCFLATLWFAQRMDIEQKKENG
ncbi:unnamed protein product [Caenorhabditis sp. 36 PRJEB53466]|nr:unnamed protein product [Caenorhabditis sp. 36 PRJEB53466]